MNPHLSITLLSLFLLASHLPPSSCQYLLVQSLPDTSPTTIHSLTLTTDLNSIFVKFSTSNGFQVLTRNSTTNTYTLGQKVSGRTSADYSLECSDNGSTLVVGHEVYMLVGLEYSLVQGITGEDGGATVSADGLLLVSYGGNSFTIWRRKSIKEVFIQNQTISAAITSAIISQNNSFLAISTRTNITLYESKSNQFQQSSQFPHQLPSPCLPLLKSLPDFSTILVYSQLTTVVNIFQYDSFDDFYAMSQTINYTGMVVSVGFTREGLVVLV